MKCDVCGSDNLEGAAYCEDCGAKLVVVPPTVAAMAAVPKAEPPPAPAPSIPVPSAPADAPAVQCPSCAAENPSTESYCVDCGANLGGAPAGEPEAEGGASAGAVAVAATVAAGSGRLTLGDGAQTFSLSGELTTLGRRSPADQVEPDIDLTDLDPDSYVSRRHAQIRCADGHYFFEDVGSSNGSFLNELRVNKDEEHPLKSGDRLRLGKTEFLFSQD